MRRAGFTESFMTIAIRSKLFSNYDLNGFALLLIPLLGQHATAPNID
jgi:hypothetical protein